METCWVVLVTDGTVIEFPPELYASRERAAQEARRWAWLLSAGGQTPVRSSFEGRWEAGFRDIRLSLVDTEGSPAHGEPWVGTYWTRDGYPDPEAVVLRGRAAATGWCLRPRPGAADPTHVEETEWSIAAVYEVRREAEYAVANLAKFVS